MSSDTITSTPVNTSGKKLYVGNVEYSTTESEIKDLFKDYQIRDVEIPTARTRGRGGKAPFKTRGYVFVNFADEVDLDAIIEKFTDSEFKGRQIYLRYPKGRDDSGEEPLDNAEAAKPSSSNKKPAARRTKAKPSQPKEKIPFELGEKSTDTLYLKNLDFALKAKDIKEYFEQEGETPEWASVPFLSLPSHVLKKLQEQGETIERRNKGYAFVKLTLGDGETIDDKVAKFNGKTLNERELLVSVAVDVRNVKPQQEAEATTNATSTSTD